MLESMNPTTGKILVNVAFPPPKYNRMWGSDFILMDGSSQFLGKAAGEAYENVITLYSTLWDSYNYQLFSNLSL
jgi:hypothetical protein